MMLISLPKIVCVNYDLVETYISLYINNINYTYTVSYTNIRLFYIVIHKITFIQKNVYPDGDILIMLQKW